MYQDLLLATDGSEATRRATEHAVELADSLEATLHIVSVSEDGPHSTENRDQLRSDPEGEAVQAAEEAEETAAGRGLEVTTTVRHGVPQEEIVEIAETESIDMIVVGTHGRTGLDHVITGSVAEEIVRHAPVPVVTVREQ